MLHRACEEGNVSVVRFLIEIYIKESRSLEKQDWNFATPLDLACIRGFDRIEKMIAKEENEVYGHLVS